MENIKKVNDYLTEAGTFFFSTVDGDKPKCRPLGFHMLHEGKIYFGLGTFKDVYKQIVANPNVEICAMNGDEFLRYYGRAEFATDPALSRMALDSMPAIKKIYEDNGYEMAVFHLADATAEFRTMMAVKEAYSF